MMDISERSFEDAIECGLLQHGPDACAGDATAVRETPPPYGDTPPGGYRKRRPEDYDRALCLLPRDVVDFVLATQPKEWQKLDAAPRRGGARSSSSKRLAAEIERRGALDVLRNGIKDSGCKFRLAYFRPGERAQRGDAAAARGEPLRRGAPAPLQREEREQPRPRAVPERHPDLHRRAEEPAQRPGRRGRDPPVQDRPRPARAAARLRPLPRPLRGGPGPGLRHHPARRAEDALPALQPGQVRRRRQPARAAHAHRATPRPTCGRRPGRATACSTSSASSSTRWRRRTTRAARPASAS